LQCIITLVLLIIKDVYVLINYLSFVEALFTTLSVSGLLWLRYKRPNAERPIKVYYISRLEYSKVILTLCRSYLNLYCLGRKTAFFPVGI
jgi:amino acid transporter